MNATELTGAGNETRTRDPDLGKVVLYQLSYSRKWRPLGDRPLDEGDIPNAFQRTRCKASRLTLDFFSNPARRQRRETGAGNETRTRDPDLGKVVLYQLSYSRDGVP